MAERPKTNASPIQLTVATAEVKKEKPEGKLFYILPPLVVLAVFVYCMCVKPNIPAAPRAATMEEKLQEVAGDMDLEDLENFVAQEDRASAGSSADAAQPEEDAQPAEDVQPEEDTQPAEDDAPVSDDDVAATDEDEAETGADDVSADDELTPDDEV